MLAQTFAGSCLLILSIWITTSAGEPIDQIKDLMKNGYKEVLKPLDPFTAAKTVQTGELGVKYDLNVTYAGISDFTVSYAAIGEESKRKDSVNLHFPSVTVIYRLANFSDLDHLLEPNRETVIVSDTKNSVQYILKQFIGVGDTNITVSNLTVNIHMDHAKDSDEITGIEAQIVSGSPKVHFDYFITEGGTKTKLSSYIVDYSLEFAFKAFLPTLNYVFSEIEIDFVNKLIKGGDNSALAPELAEVAKQIRII